MKSSRCCYFCALFLLYFGYTRQELLQPVIIRSAPASHDGLPVNFTCSVDPLVDVAFIHRYTFLLNGTVFSDGATSYVTVNMNSTFDGALLSCNYRVTTSTTPSPFSSNYTINLQPIPAPNLVPEDPTQHISDGQPFTLVCQVQSYLLQFVDKYEFRIGLTTLRRDPNTLTVTPDIRTYRNVSCSFRTSDGSPTIPFSDELPIIANAIVSTNLRASESQVYTGNNVNFSCDVTRDSLVTDPPGGLHFTIRFLDSNDTVIQNGTSNSLTMTLNSTDEFRCAAAAINTVFVVSSPVTVTVLEYPTPIVEGPSIPYIFLGNSYTFICNSSAEGTLPFTEYKWFMNMRLINSTSVNEQNFIIPYPTANISCITTLNTFDLPMSLPLTVNVTALTAPSIVATNPREIFFSESNYTFTCVSEFSAHATSYSFIFKNDATLSTTQTEASINATVDVNNPPNITCIIYNYNSLSPESGLFPMNVVVIPKPIVQSADLYYFPSNRYIFHCEPQPLFDLNYTGSSWSFNGTWTMREESNWISIDMPDPPYALSLTCHSFIDSHRSDESDPLVVTVSVVPQPTIEAAPDHGLFINGLAYNVTCGSAFSSIATEYRFIFANDNVLNRNQTEPTISLIANVTQTHDVTCIVSIFNSSSSPSEAFSMVAFVPSPPTIQLFDAPSHFLVGTQYVLECQSDLEDIVTRYCLRNFTTNVLCQSSKRFTFTPEENEKLLSCNIFFGTVFTNYSQGVIVVGSGIVSTTANASDLSPYPGTNVTLTCIANLTFGYNESHVSLWWKEGSTLIAQTKVTSVYITNNMETSFHCVGTTGVVNVSSDIVNITARDLPTPNIDVQNPPANDSYQPGHRYSLTCNSELEYLLTSYNWYKDDQLVTDVHTKQYLVQAMSYTHDYFCSYVIVAEESPGSPSLTIATKSIITVHVESSGFRPTVLRPFFDSTLNLTCEATIKSTATESPTYKWLEKGRTVDTGQQLTIVAYAGYDFEVSCEVTVGDDDMASAAVMITSTDDLPPPQISLITHQVTQILPRASYTLHCMSNSLSLNSSINWFKDLDLLSCLNDQTLHITRYDPSIHDGQYTCEISVFGMTAMSEPTAMVGIVQGK